MKIGEKEVEIQGFKGKIKIKRIEGGIPHITADDEIDVHYGPSDRRFSKYYKSLIKEWLSGEYSVLRP